MAAKTSQKLAKDTESIDDKSGFLGLYLRYDARDTTVVRANKHGIEEDAQIKCLVEAKDSDAAKQAAKDCFKDYKTKDEGSGFSFKKELTNEIILKFLKAVEEFRKPHVLCLILPIHQDPFSLFSLILSQE